jgi:hypothetical protein
MSEPLKYGDYVIISSTDFGVEKYYCARSLSEEYIKLISQRTNNGLGNTIFKKVKISNF